ncbi:MAG TPA: heavy metal-responsive transcriptional regulator [Thermoanaerobaculia bacterium]|nr:heavy metal-responsive transcriptional regulator [Thermoanaerobaculia bacterium]
MTDEIPDRPLKAGELAERAGVSKDTLRFYERRGLLPRPERTANNYRAYPPETVARVLWIRKVLASGFTVEELARILAERDRGGVPCRRVRDLGAGKLADLEERIRELEASRDNLRELLDDWDRRLEEAGPDRRAGLLDALAGRGPEPAGGSPSRKRSDKETSR